MRTNKEDIIPKCKDMSKFDIDSQGTTQWIIVILVNNRIYIS